MAHSVAANLRAPQNHGRIPTVEFQSPICNKSNTLEMVLRARDARYSVRKNDNFLLENQIRRMCYLVSLQL